MATDGYYYDHERDTERSKGKSWNELLSEWVVKQ